MKKIASFYMIVFLTILMLTGCGGASKNSAAPAAIAYDYKMEAVEETAAAYASDSIRTEETKVTSGALGSTNTIAQPIDTNRKLIRTVHHQRIGFCSRHQTILIDTQRQLRKAIAARKHTSRHNHSKSQPIPA